MRNRQPKYFDRKLKSILPLPVENKKRFLERVKRKAEIPGPLARE
jgi:hypothetical protein